MKNTTRAVGLAALIGAGALFAASTAGHATGWSALIESMSQPGCA